MRSATTRFAGIIVCMIEGSDESSMDSSSQPTLSEAVMRVNQSFEGIALEFLPDRLASREASRISCRMKMLSSGEEIRTTSGRFVRLASSATEENP
jgi:hypothetical protein